jgi:hypothetical protein
MPIIRQYKCDGCGEGKREANHWWAATVEGGELRLTTLERYENPPVVMRSIKSATTGMPCEPEALILCGQDCVMKKISAFMGAQVRAADSQADGVK